MASIGEVSEDSILIQESVIHGHHVFKEIWTSEILSLVKPETLIDRRAVALLKVDRSVVGHVPREFSIGFLSMR